MALSGIADSAERILYRIAGLPVAIGAIWGSDRHSTDPLGLALAARYWNPDDPGEWVELLVGLISWPVVLLLASAWFTWRNGAIVRERYGTKIFAQLQAQLKLYFSMGILPPWYYIFSLHDGDADRARTFIHRFETKPALFRLLKQKKGSPLNDKNRFAAYCKERGIRCVETLFELGGTPPEVPLPDRDLFVKPSTGRGGRGAERWDRVAPSRFTGPSGEPVDGSDLLALLVSRSRRSPQLIQPRLRPHRDLLDRTAGAMPTLRILTCLNARDEPEVMAAMLRTSFGKNVTVDNLHAGGIGALVDLDSGALSKSSNLGSDARLGWFSAHPDTGMPIEGFIVPCWAEAQALALAAHRHFADRVIVGWDVAIVDDGPILIEGNGNPDLDILQRFMHVGFRAQRFGELMAFHLKKHLELSSRTFPAVPSALT